MGIEIVFYKIDDNFEPDWEYLEKIIHTDIQGIMMVHYFGIPQDIKKFVEFSKKHYLILIDDNTHGFGGIFEGNLIGTIGDIGVLSPRKTFPIINGALLYVKGADYKPQVLNLEPLNIFKHLTRNFIARLLDGLLPLKKIIQNYRGPIDFDEHKVKDWAIDLASYNYLKDIDTASIRIKRTEIYNIWLKWSKKNNFSVIEINHTNYAPMLFPMLLKTTEERDKLYAFFKNKNVAVTILWNDQPLQHPSAKSILDRLICMPINLDFSPSELDEYLQTHCKYS